MVQLPYSHGYSIPSLPYGREGTLSPFIPASHRFAPVEALCGVSWPKITKFAKNYKDFGYDDLRRGKNPDLSIVEVDNQGNIIKIIGAGEAKSTRYLDQRSFLQFKYFRKSFIEIANFLNNEEHTDNHGLSEFGKNNKQITVAKRDEFKMFLFMCRDLETTHIGSLLKTKPIGNNSGGILTMEEELEFLDMFVSGAIKRISSAFSHNDLKLLLEMLKPKIQEAIKQSKPVQ